MQFVGAHMHEMPQEKHTFTAMSAATIYREFLILLSLISLIAIDMRAFDSLNFPAF